MNESILRYYLNEYKNRFQEINTQEIYKWKAVKQFQEHWDINAPDFFSRCLNSLSQKQKLA